MRRPYQGAHLQEMTGRSSRFQSTLHVDILTHGIGWNESRPLRWGGSDCVACTNVGRRRALRHDHRACGISQVKHRSGLAMPPRDDLRRQPSKGHNASTAHQRTRARTQPPFLSEEEIRVRIRTTNSLREGGVFDGHESRHCSAKPSASEFGTLQGACRSSRANRGAWTLDAVGGANARAASGRRAPRSRLSSARDCRCGTRRFARRGTGPRRRANDR